MTLADAYGLALYEQFGRGEDYRHADDWKHESGVR